MKIGPRLRAVACRIGHRKDWRPRSRLAFHVERSEKLGEWVGVRVGHRRPTLFGETKADVIAQVRKALRKGGGGEFLVMNRTGKYVERRRVRAWNPVRTLGRRLSERAA